MLPSSTTMAHANPCPNPSIPPVELELQEIPVDETHPAFPLALRVFEGYWRQATNMTIDDQLEYESLIERCEFSMVDQNGDEIDSLIKDSLFNEFLIWPTWAKYVFLKSLFGEESISAIDDFAINVFGSVETLDLEKEYRTHYRDPNLPYGEVSGEVQTPSITPSHSPLLNSGSTEQLSADCDQSNVSSLLGQSSSVVEGQASPANNEHVTERDLEKLETRLRASIVDMENRILQQVYDLRTHVMAATINNDQMPEISDEQTNLKKRKQNTVL